jgi:hypothetical protein
MVIFHSYVSLPEGIKYPQYNCITAYVLFMGQNLPTDPKISAARPALRRPLPEPEPEQTHQQDVKILGVVNTNKPQLGVVLNNPQLLKNTGRLEILTL